MPKSKRDKKVSLTKTDKKVGLESKRALVDKIRESLDAYTRVFIFETENARNLHLQKIRREWKEDKGGSVFFMGKNRVMSLALGRSAEEEVGPGLHKISALLNGQQPDFARSGGIAPQTVVLPEGPIQEMSFAIEPQLRALGLPSTLKKGILHLTKDHVVCKEGQTLDSTQARILKLFGMKHADFSIKLLAYWDRNHESGKEFTTLVKDIPTNSDGEEDDDEMDCLKDSKVIRLYNGLNLEGNFEDKKFQNNVRESNDLPPSYSDLMDNKDPPIYIASILNEEINPELNKEWATDLENHVVKPEIEDVIQRSRTNSFVVPNQHSNSSSHPSESSASHLNNLRLTLHDQAIFFPRSII
ncbi:MRT4 [Lepeophtheirus salmonis]|uniref:Ribosome assembly factor mrt4 n=1 Tax=Lepeophtheirus salmonis TaxID=72036 RepID=A0A7R8H0B6_LEPSM|nr:MRT4 [Lepeophtheirus salmonis]CAF2782852.1 MRT4 [Lepeophtheirus salmonis]